MRKILLLTIGTMFVVSCAKKVQQAEVEPATPTASGIGEVFFYDEFGASISPAGITISIDGSSVSTVTGSNGTFQLSNVSSGTFDLSFAGPGMDGYKKLGYSFVAGTSTYIGKFDLLQKSSMSVTVNTIKVDSLADGPELYFEGSATSQKTSVNAPYRSIVVFISTLFVVSPLNYSTSYYRGFKLTGTEAPYTANFGKTENRTSISVKDLYALGYKKGTRVYFTLAATASANFSPFYYDYRVQRKTFYALGPVSKTVSIILP